MEKGTVRAAYGSLMVTGISFPENVFAVSTGMDGLPSVVNSGIGKL